MASISLNLARLNRAQIIAQANLSIGMLAPAPPAPPPIAGISAEVAAVTASVAAAQAALSAWEAVKASLAAAKAAMDAAMDTLRDDLRALVSVIEGKAKGEPTMLTLSGFALASAPVPSTVPDQISNLSVTTSDMDGAVDVAWDPEVNSATYEVQVTTADPVAGPWLTKQMPTGSTTRVGGLTSGQRVWLRVRGVGSKGQGPWSDPGTKIVP